MPPYATASTSEQLLSLADIARHFSLPESTARYYCKRFAPFMPSQGEGRRKRYRQEALAVVAAIVEHMKNARTAAGVEDLLRQQFPCTTDAIVPARATPQVQASPVPSEGDVLPMLALKLMEQQTKAMEGIAASLNILAQRQQELQLLSDAAEQASQENTALRQEVHNLRVLLHSSEKIHQDDIEQVRTWVSRVARMRPSPSPTAPLPK